MVGSASTTFTSVQLSLWLLLRRTLLLLLFVGEGGSK